MTEHRHIYEGSGDNFPALVLENSARGPVLVYYWAEWAGPCHRFFPVLARVVGELAGKVLMVSINTDEQKALAGSQGVGSVPLIRIFRHGRVVEEVQGYIPEPEVLRLLDRHIPKAVDARIAQALRIYQSGAVDEGLSLLARAALDDPDNPRIPLTLGKLLMARRRFSEAQDLLTGLPDELRRQPGCALLIAHLGFILGAEAAPNTEFLRETLKSQPDNLEARYQLSAQYLVADEYEAALTELMELLKRDPGYGEGLARDGVHAIFQILGDEGELVEKYRAVLFNALH